MKTIRRNRSLERGRSRRILTLIRQVFPGAPPRRAPRAVASPWQPIEEASPVWHVDYAGEPEEFMASDSQRKTSQRRTRGSPESPAAPRKAVRFLRGVFLLLLLSWLAAPKARAQVTWLDFEDGEILNVSSADGPQPGTPFFQMRRSIERSDARGVMVMSRVRVQYGINDYMSAGASTSHLEQSYHQYHKKGMGDTNLSLKLHFRPWRAVPIRVGLRQTLSLPTGYEMERDGLAPFTSRHNDYSAQVLLQYVDRRFSAYLNPGTLLPGGKAPSYLTGGLGLACTPIGRFDLRGEYYTRWNMAERAFESEVFGSVRHPLFWGLSVQAGAKRRLLQDQRIDPEFNLALSFGRDRTPDAELYEVHERHRAVAGLLVHPVESLVYDPDGIALSLIEAFRNRGVERSGAVAVFAGTSPAEQVAASRTRHYELDLRILNIREGNVGGMEAPSVLRVARSTTEITAQAELIAPDGYSVVQRAVYQGKASRLLGVDLAPDSGSLESTVTPDEIRTSLRERAIQDLADQILDASLKLITQRDAQ